MYLWDKLTQAQREVLITEQTTSEEADIERCLSGSYAFEDAVLTRTVEQIMVPLRTARLLRSVRGAKGGYYLARPPEQIRLKEIVAALEGDLGLVQCVTEPDRCDKAATCAARGLWCEMHGALDSILSRTTLADLSARQDTLRAAGAESYEI